MKLLKTDSISVGTLGKDEVIYLAIANKLAAMMVVDYAPNKKLAPYLKKLRESGIDARLILQVHDELIVEAPEEEAKAVCDEISKLDNIVSVTYVSSEEGLESLKESFLEGQEEYFTFLDDEYGNRFLSVTPENVKKYTCQTYKK
mgnify:CR=1 FL=1